jgi:hypothetical protein
MACPSKVIADTFRLFLNIPIDDVKAIKSITKVKIISLQF